MKDIHRLKAKGWKTHFMQVEMIKKKKNWANNTCIRQKDFKTKTMRENQDGGVGGRAAPPHTTRTDGESNGKEV